jgi:hypothetical protein
VDVERLAWLADGGGRIGLRGQGRQQPLERLGGGGWQAEPGRQSRDRFP